MKGIKSITISEYLLFVGFSCILSGIFLFVYLILVGIPLIETTPMSNPLFYLILGFGVFAVRFIDGVVDRRNENAFA